LLQGGIPGQLFWEPFENEVANDELEKVPDLAES
jgi:hypothetical protein